MKHDWRKCEGVLCEADRNPNWKKDVVWYAGEMICGKRPYSKIQRTQNKINRLFKKGRIKYPDRYFTGEILEKIMAVKDGVKGRINRANNWR